jgi:5-methylcytosine-specific restriction endonuclease McrA
MRMKKKIPAALRQQVWIQKIGRVFESKCKTPWCSNMITVFNYECGHNIPESKGGITDITNLLPICRQCNSSMSNNYTFDDWSLIQKQKPYKNKWFSCFKIFKVKPQA